MYTSGNVRIVRRCGLLRGDRCLAGDSEGADAQEVESRVSGQVGVTVPWRDCRHQRFESIGKYSGRT